MPINLFISTSSVNTNLSGPFSLTKQNHLCLPGMFLQLCSHQRTLIISCHFIRIHMDQYLRALILCWQVNSWVSRTSRSFLALDHRYFYLISGRIAYWNQIMFNHRLGFQLEVASKCLLPGLLVETPIKILFILNQGYVFWISL